MNFFQIKHGKIKILSAALIGILAIASLTGCGGQNDSAGGDKDQIVIGTQNLVNGDLIAQKEKWYEQELGVPVKIVKFDSGKDVNAALASGSIDIGQEGTAPAALAIANGVDIDIIWINDILGSAETLVAKNDSDIHSLQDLKGKRVATPFSSTSHYSLLQALKKAGIDENEVKIIDMQPDKINAAWQTGDIDAAYIWYPVLDQLLKNGTPIIDSAQLAKQGVVTADVTVVNSKYAKAHPDIVKKYIKIQERANDMILNDKDKAVKDMAAILELSEEDVAKQITGYTYLTKQQEQAYLDNTFAKSVKDIADFLVETKSILSAPELSVYQQHVTSDYVKGE